ncbi:hypothetical protein [Nocardioides panacisoli]|uniref:Flagellar FliJ protein n=1 Tax=Nocardioides panacisoli TaxID=627624 RepID=A0ABP7HQD2_9ACTN
MSRVHAEDRGLAAVARVRGVREQDSRIGLRLAAAEAASRGRRAEELHERLAVAEVPETSTPGLLLARRTALAVLGEDGRTARIEAASAVRLTEQAHHRWDSDRARLAAVDHLLERRAQRRRAEAARREQKDADDMTAQRWLRATDGEAAR